MSKVLYPRGFLPFLVREVGETEIGHGTVYPKWSDGALTLNEVCALYWRVRQWHWDVAATYRARPIAQTSDLPTEGYRATGLIITNGAITETSNAVALSSEAELVVNPDEREAGVASRASLTVTDATAIDADPFEVSTFFLLLSLFDSSEAIGGAPARCLRDGHDYYPAMAISGTGSYTYRDHSSPFAEYDQAWVCGMLPVPDEELPEGATRRDVTLSLMGKTIVLPGYTTSSGDPTDPGPPGDPVITITPGTTWPYTS